MTKKSHYRDSVRTQCRDGFVLEYNCNDERIPDTEKLVFSVFYGDFQGYHIIQDLREFMIVRKDKYRKSIFPGVRDIRPIAVSRNKMIYICKGRLDNLVKKDQIEEFPPRENRLRLDLGVIDYFYNKLHCCLREPLFSERPKSA